MNRLCCEGVAADLRAEFTVLLPKLLHDASQLILYLYQERPLWIFAAAAGDCVACCIDGVGGSASYGTASSAGLEGATGEGVGVATGGVWGVVGVARP